jgi:phosphate transport system substrate-binding protein
MINRFRPGGPTASVRRWLGAAAVGAALAGTGWAQPSPGDPPVVPATPEEQARVRQFGSTLPGVEFLQPTLDARLPAYQRRTDVELAGHLQGCISDNVPDLVRRWIEAFRALHPKVSFDAPPPYGGTGTQKLMTGEIDFCVATRDPFPAEISAFKGALGYEPLSIPVSGGTYRHFEFLDAMVFIVHESNPLERITFGQLDQILSSTHHRGGGAITTWGQLGLAGDWAGKPIHPWGMKPHAGFEEFILRGVLSTPGKRGAWRDDLNLGQTIFPVVEHVSQDPYAIGYTAMAYVRGPVKKLLVAENNAGPYHAPTYEEVALATYPLCRVFDINVNKAPGKPLKPELEEFIRFILSREGQAIILQQAVFIPLRAAQAEQARLLLNP